MRAAKWLLLSVMLCLPFQPQAQETQMTVEEEATHNELRAVRDALVAAINESDVDAILEHVHDNIVFTGMNGEVARGRDELRTFFERMMVGPDRILESLTIEITVDALTILYGGDTGVVYGSSVDNYKLASGLEFDVTTRWSSTLVKEGDRWLVASYQSASNIFDNPILAQATEKLFWAAGIAALIGLIVGVIAGRMSK